MTRSFLLRLIFTFAFCLITALSLILFTCLKKDKFSHNEEIGVYNDLQDEGNFTPMVTAENDVISEAGNENNYQVSYHRQIQDSDLQALSRIGGKVNVSEINPINFDNPDINTLRQMGVQQYLISYFNGEQFYKTGNFDKAIIEYTSSINSYDNFIESFISRGNSFIKKKEYSRAIDDYTRAIRLDNAREEIFNYRGFARTERSEYNLAIDDFSAAISLNINYVDALINRSYVYYQMGNYDKTIEDCSRILRLEPENAFIWNRRGSAWYGKQDDDRAISDFTEAIRLKNDYTVALKNRANAWHNKKEYEKSLVDFQMAEFYETEPPGKS